MAKGKNLEETKKITNKLVAETLGGLASNKMHCSNLGAEALTLTINNYQAKRSGAAASLTQGNPEDKVHS